MVAGAVARQVGNLPADLTSFVGRRRELAEIRRLLSASRLVTLTGVGGVGKTRLALRAAAEQRRAFDCVWLVDLSTVTDPALVADTVAATMGVRDEPATCPVDALEQVLSSQRTLLVLDNCEHLRDACAVLADRLLRAAPELRILATSRQSLGITGEHQMKISPLPVPEPDRPLDRRSLGLYDGINLLTERAAAVLPGFTLTEDNQAAVAELCRQLDGIPLAIELAAVRLRALSVNALVERLRDRYRLLTAGSSTAVPRQQTLHALVDWSFQLLPDAERRLWTRLSIFPSHFDLDAVEAVCTGDGIERDDVLDLLDALLDKSLLLREEHAGTVRYRMLDTLREFGRKRLGGAERRSLRRRHRNRFLRLAEQAAADWFGPCQISWSSRLRLEQANMRAAMDFCLQEPCEAEAGLRMATLLTEPYWITGAFYNEGRHWLDRMLEAAPEPTTLRARALLADALMALIQGDTEPSLALLDKGRALAEELGEAEVLGLASLVSGMAAQFRGDYRSAVELLERAVAGHEAAGNVSGTLMSLLTLAAAVSNLGDKQRATELFERSVALTRSHEESAGQAWALTTFAIHLWQCGDTERAFTHAREGLMLGRDFGDRLKIATNLETLGWLLVGEGRDPEAARLFGAVEEVGRMMGLAPSRVKFYTEVHERCVATLKSRMGDRALKRELRRGSRLTLDEAIEEALGDRAGGGRTGPDEAVAEGEPTRPGRRAAAACGAEPSPLTRREREIAELIAQGRSNKEIAAALVISQRTVEGHVEHILDKLGFASRAQIAAWMAAREAGGRP
ncbi:LuxR C-terminal-related transcriptional regulator [Microbispora sp. NPDC046933]|uniref:ATP-binding protein n=1 Tax=Microbispora sp. NPDC046933 TaxID=3155618 RepID=UPI0033D2DD57